MHDVNILIFFSIILLVSLFCRIKGDFEVIKDQKQIAPRPQPENNLDETPDESVITTVDDEKFDDNELRKLFVRNFKLYKKSGKENIMNDTEGTARLTRDAVNETSKLGTECVSCFGNGSSAADLKCYEGIAPRTKCSDAEQCFVELNPQYLRRGCMLIARVNRTFYCRCPLCNDKPSSDDSYYDYTTYEDWVFDNYLLDKPLAGLDLMCKVCVTAGTNSVADKNCRQGKGTDFMVCGHNQLCYINIDDEIDHVTRGCKTRPVFNSMYYFCNKTGCNDQAYVNPHLTFRTLPSLVTETKMKSARSDANRIQSCSFNLIFVCILFASK